MMKYITTPNCLTCSRLLLAPILIPWAILCFMENACLIFSVLVTTDYLDGFCARLWRQETSLGKWLDPLADKVVLVSVLLPLVSIHLIHWSIAALFIIREFVVLAARHGAALSSVSLSVSWWGKCKTAAQFSYFALCLAVPHYTCLCFSMMILATSVTIGSMLAYVHQWLRAIRVMS